MTDPVTAYIGLGSNLEGPERQVLTAFGELDSLPDSRLRSRSSLYCSAPMGPPDQPDYVNAVARLETALTPLALLDALQQIENAHGRRRDIHWGARTLDLDILLYGREQISTETLTVPHAGMAWRSFVLYPLAELERNLDIPGLGSLTELLQACPDKGLVRLTEDATSSDVGC